jgi:hypothetical protein
MKRLAPYLACAVIGASFSFAVNSLTAIAAAPARANGEFNLVRARGLVIADETGRELVQILADSKGPALVMKNGDAVLLVTVDPAGPNISLMKDDKLKLLLKVAGNAGTITAATADGRAFTFPL